MVVKINVSIAEEVLKQLDAEARDAKTSRSAFLTEAVEHYLQERREEKLRQRRLEAVRSIRKIAEEVGPWDGTAEILKWRDAH